MRLIGSKKPLYIVLSVLIIFSICQYNFLLNLNYNRASESVRHYVVQWEQDIAKTISENKDSILIEKLLNVLETFPISSYELILSENRNVIYSWFDDSNIPISECPKKQYVEEVISIRSAQLGKMKICISSHKISKKTIFSPLSILIIFVVVILIFIAAWLTLLDYKKSLGEVISILESNKINDFNVNKISTINSSDKVTHKIIHLVKKLIESESNMKDLKSSLESEKEHSRLRIQVAHDIRGPISDLESAFDEEGESADKHKLIKMAINRVFEICNELMEPDLISRYKITQVIPINIVGLLEDLLKTKRISHKNIDFTLKAPQDIVALCSPMEFKRVFSNLIINSIEAIGDTKGHIHCDIVDETEGVCKIVITDSGKGIAKEHITMIFEYRFTAGKDAGNGLGLYYVKKKVVEWGGNINIKSEPHKGTVIEVILQAPKKKMKERKIKLLNQPLMKDIV